MTKWAKEEDSIIKAMTPKAWGKEEISYEIFKKCDGSTRTPASILQRASVLSSEGKLTLLGTGRRYVTQEALDWTNSTFKTNVKPSKMIVLRERKKSKKTKKTKKSKKHYTSKKTRARELIGFNGVKGPNEPNPSYAVLIARLSRDNNNVLDLFRALLESAMNESKTAPEVVDDLKLIGA